jgi:hypothetical protein
MTTAFSKLIACTVLGTACMLSAAHDGPDQSYRLAPGLGPVRPAPEPVAKIRYRSTWNWSPSAGGARDDEKEGKDGKARRGTVNYCVYPQVRITPRATGPTAPNWEASFSIELVNAAGAPAAPSFAAAVVPTPIPVNTTRKLEPQPEWCAEVRGARLPPEIFLQVGSKKVRVEFTTRPNTNPHTHPPGTR